MVAEGWAFADRRYSEAYVADENRARAAGIGIWSSRLVKPWEWRRDQRVARRDEADAGPGGCAIKGNINQRGEKIYHQPGGRWYAQTGIDESHGER
ncbi:MAG: thermonuclease family protein, partial [Rhodospirillales bacterium]